MVYRDRKYLSILTLTEEQDYVTYDELIQVLKDRPSNAVYIERGGILYGLITSGRIERSCNEKKRCVPFNKRYTYVHPEEYLRARQIFRDKANINILPIVSKGGHLLGDYIRYDNPICQDYAEVLYRSPHVLQALKTDIQNRTIIFVKPSVHGAEEAKTKMSMWWIQIFNDKNIPLQVIQQWEKEDYLNVADGFLFVDEAERAGFHDLYLRLFQRKIPLTYTIIEYLYNMKHLASAHLNESILKELQNRGVFVLVFDFKENNNHFLTTLNERIRKRIEEYDVIGRLPEELRESFAGELYCETYKTQKLPIPTSYYRKYGISYLSDVETEFLHVRNGERLTVDQPEKYDRCIYLYGPCIVTGMYVPDRYTISSVLQSEINLAGFSCKVVNRGFVGGRYLNAERIYAESFEWGDIVVLDYAGSMVENFPVLNLTDALEKHDAPIDWFCDDVRHCNHKANQVCAHAIYEALLPVLQKPPKERTPIELDIDYIDYFYLNHYFTDFDSADYGVIGSIVMNCNPFTFGHRFLIEEALKTVDFLIIFVVEEDKSLFSFQERFAMVCQGISDLEHIMVVPSGPYILSQDTFPEYFEKIDDGDLKKNTEDDVTLFAEKIAPKLGIKYRFVGEEREDKVTNEYNEAMKRILPRYGIQVVEIPRKTNGQSVISASRVRQCLSMNRMDELDDLIPDSTKRILFYENK